MALSKADRKLIETAVKRLKIAVEADSHNRTAAVEDLRFSNGEQWDSKERKRRADKGRPALTLNFLPKFIDQVVGDMLHACPSIKLHPVDSLADISIAKIRQGIISQVEYQSNSKGIYGYAGKQMVTCGYGAWRVLTRYTEENPFLQEAYLEGIRNPFMVFMDPTSKDQNYADAKWGILLEKVAKKEFESRYPKAVVPTEEFKKSVGTGSEHWFDSDAVTVAEYFEKRKEPQMMLQLEDGRVCTEDEYKEIKKEWEEKHGSLLDAIGSQAPPALPAQGLNAPPPGAAPQPSAMPAPQAQPLPMGPVSQGAPPPATMTAGPTAPPQQAPVNPLLQQAKDVGDEPRVAKRRETEVTVIRHWILTCCEILSGDTEGSKFPGKLIPLVLVKGKELNIEGKNYVKGLVRDAKDPQKLINYWNSAAAETIALAPKAPWLGTPKQFENFEMDYATANVDNMPMLKYNPDPEAPGPPQRQQPSNPPTAIFEQIRRGEDNLKSVLGMFNADVGAPVSQQTGAAVNAVQRSGDIGTFEYMENMARAIMYTGKILNEMIPELYDTERDVRVRNIDETESFVPVNTTIGKAVKSLEKNPERFKGIDIAKLRTMFSKNGKDAKFNDVTAGKYDVVVSIGPSYATQRQESSQHLMQLVQSAPQQMGVALDLIVQNMDFKDADELSSRLRKPLIAAGITKPRPGETPPMPQQPPPQVLLAQAKLQLQQMKIQQENIKLEHEKIKMQLELAKLQAQVQGNPVDVNDLQEKAIRLQLESERLSLEKEKFAHQRDADHARIDNDRFKAESDFAHKMSQTGADDE